MPTVELHGTVGVIAGTGRSSWVLIFETATQVHAGAAAAEQVPRTSSTDTSNIIKNLRNIVHGAQQ
jgi:hypothetical protein